MISILAALGPGIGNMFSEVVSELQPSPAAPATPAPTGTPAPTPTPVPTPDWIFCANEGGVCTFSGTREVRYGANNIYAYGTFTGGTPCNNTIFGDPIYGTFKYCHYR